MDQQHFRKADDSARPLSISGLPRAVMRGLDPRIHAVASFGPARRDAIIAKFCTFLSSPIVS
jgi:hypothetical protein